MPLLPTSELMPGHDITLLNLRNRQHANPQNGAHTTRAAEWSYLGSYGIKAIVKRILCKSQALTRYLQLYVVGEPGLHT
jgi:hypothetical protein